MSSVRSSKATTAPSEKVRVAFWRRILAEVRGARSEVRVVTRGPAPRIPNPAPPLVPPWIARPGTAVALDGLLDNRLLNNLVGGQLGLHLDGADRDFALDGVVDQVFRHPVVDAPDAGRE